MGLFNTFINWVVDVAGEGVGAVTAVAAEAAVSGAIIGAASAALTGEDILQSALKGAAYAGLAGGVASSLGQLSGMESLTANKQLEMAGISGDKTVLDNSMETPQNVITENLKSDSIGTVDSTGEVVKSAVEKPWHKTEAGVGILAGVAKGAAGAAGGYLSEKERSKAAEEEQMRGVQIDKAKIAANTPGAILNQPTPKLEIRQWWENKLTPKQITAPEAI